MINFRGFILSVFLGFSEQSIRSCVLRNYDLFPDENIGSDVDILIPRSDLDDAIDVIRGVNGIRITSIVARAYVVSIFVDRVDQSDNKSAIQIDLVLSLSWKGFDYLSAERVLECSVPIVGADLINKPLPEHEAVVSLFSSYLLGGWVKDRYQDYVRGVFVERECAVKNELSCSLGEKLSAELVDAVQKGLQDKMLKMLPAIKCELVNRAIISSPLRSFAAVCVYYFSEIRIRFTPYPLREIVVLGVDGAGKSTVIKGVTECMVGCVKGVKVIHLKPKLFGLVGAESAICTDPHSLPPRSDFISVLKLLSWVFSYHVFRFFHGQANSTLIVWDRHIYDVLIDARRYRVGLPRWVVQFISRLVPKPMAIIFLDVLPEVAFSRKRECSISDLTDLRDKYLSFDFYPELFFVIDTNGDVSESITGFRRLVGDVISRRV